MKNSLKTLAVWLIIGIIIIVSISTIVENANSKLAEGLKTGVSSAVSSAIDSTMEKKMASIKKEILADEKVLLGVIRTEIQEISDKFGDDRKSKIGYDVYDISVEDMIPNENTIIAMSNLGYVKRMTIDNFKSQHRGGKGIKGMQTIEDDFIADLLMTTTHHYIMFFTNFGRVYRL